MTTVADGFPMSYCCTFPDSQLESSKRGLGYERSQHVRLAIALQSDGIRRLWELTRTLWFLLLTGCPLGDLKANVNETLE